MRFDISEPMGLLPSAAGDFIREAIATDSEDGNKASEPQPFLLRIGNDGAVESLAWGEGDRSKYGDGVLAVIPIVGGLMPWKMETIRGHVRAAARNSQVRGILLDITSPGGTVTGTPELGDAVREVRDGREKMIWTLAHDMMASAATWIGTAADRVLVTPSGRAGSIGVISVYSDWSKYLEELGIKYEIVRTPSKKARFSGVEPLTDEMREHMEQRNREAYADFLEAMANNRGVKASQVEERFGGGEMMLAGEAVAAGLVDGTATFEAVVAEMLTRIRDGADRRRKLQAAENWRVPIA